MNIKDFRNEVLIQINHLNACRKEAVGISKEYVDSIVDKFIDDEGNVTKFTNAAIIVTCQKNPPESFKISKKNVKKPIDKRIVKQKVDKRKVNEEKIPVIKKTAKKEAFVEDKKDTDIDLFDL